MPAQTIESLRASLPSLPEFVEAAAARGTRREPTIDELNTLRYFIGFADERVTAFAITFDRFDWHTCNDVREVLHLAGTKRGVHEMLLWQIALSKADARALIGDFPIENQLAIRHAARIGFRVERFGLAMWHDEH